ILFIELEREIPNLHDGLSGKAWARVDERLNGLATELGLIPLSDLTSTSPEQFAELMEDCPNVDIAAFQEEWFDPAEGLRTVKGLFEHLLGRPDMLDRLEHAEDVLDDMQEAMKILRAAAAEGVRFHFGWAF